MSVAFASFEAVMWSGPGTQIAGIQASWTNNLGYAIFIKEAEIWIGEQGKAVTDTPFHLSNLTQQPDDGPIISAGWDHYNDPSSIDANDYRTPYFGEDYYLCMPGDMIQLVVQSVAYNTTPQAVSAGAMFRYLK